MRRKIYIQKTITNTSISRMFFVNYALCGLFLMLCPCAARFLNLTYIACLALNLPDRALGLVCGPCMHG